MFISDLYMSTWPIKFIRGVRELFLVHKSFPTDSSGEGKKEAGTREEGGMRLKGEKGQKHEAAFLELLPIISFLPEGPLCERA